MFVRDEWFHLARYHDFDHDKRGQAMLAEALGMAIDEVFPIRYDIGKWVSGVGADTVRGTVHAVPWPDDRLRPWMMRRGTLLLPQEPTPYQIAGDSDHLHRTKRQQYIAVTAAALRQGNNASARVFALP